MHEIHYVQEVCQTYLVLEYAEEQQKDVYSLKILQNNGFKYFLPFQMRCRDGLSQCYYGISGNQSLSEQMKGGLVADQIEAVAKSLLGALDEMDEHLLDIHSLLLDPACIFAAGDLYYQFTCYPGYSGDIIGQLGALAERFLKCVDYTNEAAVRCVYEFYHRVTGGADIWQSLKSFVKAASDRNGMDRDCVSDRSEQTEPKTDFFDHGCPQKEQGELKAAECSGKAGAEQNAGEAARALGHVWIGLAAVIALEAVCFFLIHKWRPSLKPGILWLMAGVCFAITLAVGILFLIRQKDKDEPTDFWRSEDYIPVCTDIRSAAGSGQNVSANTTLLQAGGGGVLFKSANPALYDDLRISVFPALIGKEVQDRNCRIEIPTVSRRHAKIEYVGREFRLTDLHSSNGTFINGEQIASMKSEPLCSGDSVIFSDIEFIFEILGGK